MDTVALARVMAAMAVAKFAAALVVAATAVARAEAPMVVATAVPITAGVARAVVASLQEPRAQ